MTATIGSVFKTLCRMGVPTLSAWNLAGNAYALVKWDDDGRPYLLDGKGVRWFVDDPCVETSSR